jgi:hypothetical protein
VLCFVNLGVYRPFSPIWDAAGLLNKWPGFWPLLEIPESLVRTPLPMRVFSQNFIFFGVYNTKIWSFFHQSYWATDEKEEAKRAIGAWIEALDPDGCAN